MPHGKPNILIQLAMLTAVGTAVGLADLVVRGGDVQTELEVSDGTAFELPTDPATPSSSDPIVETPAADAPPAPPAPRPEVPEPDAGDEPAPAAAETPAQTDANDPLAEPAVMPEGHIALAQAYGLYTADRATFIDARPHDEYVTSHIAGSWSFPISAFDSGDPMKMLDLEFAVGMDRPLIVYCSGGEECEAAEDVAIQFQMSGYNEIRILHVGLPGWEAAGYPIESGEDPNG